MLSTKEKIEALMLNGYTQHDAVKHVNNGSIFYPDNEVERDEFIRSYTGGGLEEFRDEAEMVWNQFETVFINGSIYRVQIFL